MNNLENALAYTERILKRYELRAKKSLGQNFLIDDGVLAKIIEESGLEQGDNVLEIGPGTGSLTRGLLEKAGQMWAVELDDTLSEVLQEEFRPNPRLRIIHGDALELRLEDLGLAQGEKLRLIANLPYYITSPLINHFLDQRGDLLSMTVMVQEEVAKRICADPGSKDYGILSVAVQVYSRAKILFKVPAGAFLPAPKVSSAVVQLDILDEPRVALDREEDFFQLVRAAFGQRRKTMVNSLSQGLGQDKAALTAAVEMLGISPMARAEVLSIEDFCRLTELVFAQKQG